MATDMVKVDDAARALASPGLGYERVKVMHGGSFKSAKTVVIVPTRGMINHRVVQAWQALLAPMNQARGFIFAAGDEVGVAYNKAIANVLADPVLSTWDYVLTLEDDNLPPPDAHIRLLESIDQCNADASSGIYWTRGDLNMPMAYGDADVTAATGAFDFAPLSPARCIEAMNNEGVVRVNGIAMGCALWRMDLFRQLSAPWFVTVSDLVDGGARSYTQDLFFCERASKAGKRFVVDFRVRVGHLDVNTGVVY